MSKKMYSLAFFAIPAMVLVLAGCGNPYSSSPGPTVPQTPPSTNNSPPAAGTQTPNDQATTPSAQNQTGSAITVKNFAFTPADLTVIKGTTVTWTNEDSAPHQIASDTGDAVSFSGSSMSPGQTFSFKFDAAGTFPYHCAIHSSMHGTITVK
jgi:plastocyanin